MLLYAVNIIEQAEVETGLHKYISFIFNLNAGTKGDENS